MINVKHILELYRERRVKLLSESTHRQLWEVDDQTVVIQVKKGRRIITCSCDNHTRFCNSSTICRHKEAVVAYPVIENILKQLDVIDHDARILRMRFDDQKSVKESFDRVINKIHDMEMLRWVPLLK